MIFDNLIRRLRGLSGRAPNAYPRSIFERRAAGPAHSSRPKLERQPAAHPP